MNEKEGASLHDQLLSGLTGDDTNNEPETEELETEEVEEGTEEDTAEGEETEETEEETEDEDAEGEETEEEEGEEEEAEEGEEKPAKAAKPAKEPDPINDPLPKGTLESTRERFQHVVGRLKEETTRADAAESQLTDLVTQIQSTGMDADKYAVMLQYAAGVNSGDPEQMRRSYQIMMGEMTRLATALGEPLPGQNPVEAHADLVKLLQEGKITPELAAETAINRNRKAALEKLQEAKASNEQGTAAYTQAQAKSQADFSALGQQLARKDGAEEYKRKAGIVVKMFQASIMALHPSKRVAAFKHAYDNVPALPKTVAPKPGVGKVPVKKGATPLRGNKRPSGNSTQKAPKNLLTAMRQAFTGGDE